MKTLRAVAVIAITSAALLWCGAIPASADDVESITGYATTIAIDPSGTMHVSETIDYDFGSNARHGIFRDIPVRFHYDDYRDRVYQLNDITVTRDGHSEDFEKSTPDQLIELKVGRADRTLTGTHKYVITYTVTGGLNGFTDHSELYWNVIGEDWQVPIHNATATVTAPATIENAACFAGPLNSHTPCTSVAKSGTTATFSQTELNPREAFTVVVAMPVGAVTNTAPILVQRHGVMSFRPTALTLGVGAGFAVVGVLIAGLAGWLVGRDRRYAGFLPGLTPGYGQSAPEVRKPLFGAPPVSVEFVPPDNVRPGQVGTLVDERADTIDVVATIVDFAVRKHLRIRELPLGRSKDWELVKLTDGDSKFLPYEQELFAALFNGRDTVRLSELRNTFATEFNLTKSRLYQDMVAEGWYRASPQTTRNRGRGIGALCLVLSVGITVLLAAFTQVALIGIGLIIGSLALLLAANRFPARTGKGSAALARVQGFRLFVATAQADQIRWEEREQIFSAYLPFAMVFGLTERWAQIFGDLGAVQPDGTSGLYWYSGSPGWTFLAFSHSFNSFAATTATSIASTPPSASGSSGFGGGGFSGGGGGGGGGGSW
jgi:uncharacterized membrane protein YgcG